jgi:hypothetical protein
MLLVVLVVVVVVVVVFIPSFQTSDCKVCRSLNTCRYKVTTLLCLHYINACIVVSATGDWNTSDTSAEASVITELLFASLHHLLSMQLMASDSFVRVGDCFVKRAFPGAYRSKTYVCVT